jgi:hypothetical protein
MARLEWAGLVAACALVAGCGGGGSSGNAAAGRKFTYGAPAAATLAQTQALDGQLALAAAQQAQPDADGAAALADISGVSATLLGGSGLGSLLPLPEGSAHLSARLATAQAAALAVAPTAFDNPGCLVATATSVTMSHCSLTVVDVDSTMTTVLDGFFKVPAPGSLAWDLTVRITLTSADLSMTGSAHQAGTLAATATSVVGALRNETGVSVQVQGQSASAGLDESLDVDVTVDPTPPACITGGTLEVKRVWTQRPQGASSADLPDGAAKVTWTGCGIGTIEVSR